MTVKLLCFSLFISAGDGRLGYAEGGPYDAIHVGAAAAVIPNPVNDSSYISLCYIVSYWFMLISISSLIS